MVRILLMAALLAGCSSKHVIYENLTDEGRASTIEMPSKLPLADFEGTLTDPDGKKFSVEFHFVQLTVSTCYWSKLVSICTGDGTEVPDTDRGPEGLRVRVEPIEGNLRDLMYVAYGDANGLADYAISNSGNIKEFGIMDLSNGSKVTRFVERK